MRGVEYKPRLGLGGGLFGYKRGGLRIAPLCDGEQGWAAAASSQPLPSSFSSDRSLPEYLLVPGGMCFTTLSYFS